MSWFKRKNEEEIGEIRDRLKEVQCEGTRLEQVKWTLISAIRMLEDVRDNPEHIEKHIRELKEALEDVDNE